MNSRNCTKCGEIKAVSEFHKHKRCKGGYNSVCKQCRLPLSKANYAGSSTEARMLDRARGRARRRGLPFDIDISDIVVPDVCPVLGTAMDIPSLDRHKPALGYVKGNVVVMSSRANMLKNNGTLEEFLKMVSYLGACEL